MDILLIDEFLDILLIFGGMFALVYSALAYVRFNKGEFKDILAWVLLAYSLAFLFAAVSVLGGTEDCNVSAGHVMVEGIFVLAIFSAFVSSMKIYEFSKAFGFGGNAVAPKAKKAAGKK